MECTRCGKSFKRKSHLKRHMESAQYCLMKTLDLSCEICEKKFSRKDHLENHICSINDLIIQINSLKNKIIEQNLKEEQFSKIEKELLQVEAENRCLKEQIDKVLKRSNTKNTFVNKKKITIVVKPERNFSKDQFIEAVSNQKLTRKHVRGGFKGIARFIGSCVIGVDGIPNYVVSDGNRNKFKYFFRDLWRDDIGGRKLVDEVYPSLIPQIKEIAEEEYDNEMLEYRSSPYPCIVSHPVLDPLSDILRLINCKNYLRYDGEWNIDIVKELRVILKHFKQLAEEED